MDKYDWAMSALGNLVRQLREERNLTLRDMEAKTGIAYSGIAARERGDTKIKPPDRKKFAKAFGMSLADFDNLWRASKVERTVGGDGIPVINRAPAGTIIDYNEYGVDSGQGFEYIDRGSITDPLVFAVIVVGDSMEPTLFEGDYLVLSPATIPKPLVKVENGSLVFVRFAEESDKQGCCLCRIHDLGGGKIQLSKDNRRYPHCVVDREEISQLSVAVERRTKRL